MNVTIVGAGNLGRNIAHWLISGKHSVTIIDSNLLAALKLAAELRAKVRLGVTVKTASIDNVVIIDEIVVLASCSPKTEENVKRLGQQLTNKIVIDISNPVNLIFDPKAISFYQSSAQRIAPLLPAGATIVKVINPNLHDILIEDGCYCSSGDVFIAGDDPFAKNIIAQLVAEIGAKFVDMGPLSQSRHLEGLGLLAELRNLIKIRNQPLKNELKHSGKNNDSEYEITAPIVGQNSGQNCVTF